MKFFCMHLQLLLWWIACVTPAVSAIELVPRYAIGVAWEQGYDFLHVFIHSLLCDVSTFLLRLSEKFQRKSHRSRTVSQPMHGWIP